MRASSKPQSKGKLDYYSVNDECRKCSRYEFYGGQCKGRKGAIQCLMSKAKKGDEAEAGTITSNDPS